MRHSVALLLGLAALLPHCALAAEHATGLKADDPVLLAKVAWRPTFRAFVPPKADLLRYLPTIRSQGTQGSCTAWATGYTAMSAAFNRAIELNASPAATAPKLEFSPSYIFNLIHRGDCDGGTSMTEALNTIRDKGLASLSDFPYDPKVCSNLPDNALAERARNKRLIHYTRIDRQNKNSIEKIRGAIYSGQPVVIGMNTGGEGSIFDKYTGGIFDSLMPATGGHAMVIVGYDDEEQVFTLANSWGTRWGEAGLMRIRYASLFANLQSDPFVVDEIDPQGLKEVLLASGALPAPPPAPVPQPVPQPLPVPAPVPKPPVAEPVPVPPPAPVPPPVPLPAPRPTPKPPVVEPVPPPPPAPVPPQPRPQPKPPVFEPPPLPPAPPPPPPKPPPAPLPAPVPAPAPKPVIAPAPLSLDALRREVEQRTAKLGCANIEAKVGADRSIRLRGFAGSGADVAKLAAGIKALPGAGRIDNELTIYPWPQCEVYLNFAQTLREPAGLSLRLQGKSDAVYRDGESLALEVTTPNFPSYLYVAYLQASGEVAHLNWPDGRSPRPVAPNSKVVLGGGQGGQPVYRIGKPFGDEILVVVASGSPLFVGAAPRNDSDREYLSSFRSAFLAKPKDGSGQRRVVAAVINLKTLAKE